MYVSILKNLEVQHRNIYQFIPNLQVNRENLNFSPINSATDNSF